MALAAKDLQATVAFYQEVFDLESSELIVPGEEPNVLLYFPNGSFLHVIDSSTNRSTDRIERTTEGNLLYTGQAIDHLALSLQMKML